MSVVEVTRDGRVGVAQVNRPEVLNALDTEVLTALTEAMEAFAEDPGIGAILLRGGERAFSAGADIRESEGRRFPDVLLENWQADWARIAGIRVPVVAAVRGHALGGGCELAMMCDLVIAAQDARFGQPEITLGVIPGMGGTQRLTRAIGKAKAADLLLTGRTMDAEEAERAGLVSRVVPAADLDAAAMQAAQTIAGYGRSTALLLKAAMTRAFETSLAEGLAYERLAFHACFATAEQAEGMAAFAQKRAPRFHAAEVTP